MKREPLVLLGMPLEKPAVARPGWFAICCGLLFVSASYLVGWLIDGANL